MEDVVKVELILEGLDCANCATKIEKKVTGIEGVSKAIMNFMSKTLTIEYGDKNNTENIIRKAKAIINEYEPDVVVKEKSKSRKAKANENMEEENSKKEVILLTISGIAFGAAMIYKFPFWISFVLYLISFLLSGYGVILKAVRNIIRGDIFDENFLMSVATIGAFSIKKFPEAAAVMIFYQLGEFFQDMAVNKSRKSIAALMNIRQDYANLKVGEEIKIVSPEEVNIGDIIIVKPGERVPLDGKVLSGKSAMDTSALTGESLPRDVMEGDDVLSGFINKNGLLNLKVTKPYGESTVSKILELVENAGSKKAKTENFITKFAKIYTPAVVGAAMVLAFIPPLFIQGATFSQWIYRALIFLVISCPCALVISIPLAFFAGIGGASKNGILVKGGNYFEALNNVDTVVFDKTGTLTRGKFKVTEINEAEGFTRNEILECAAYAESFSNHPIAVSILNEYSDSINKNEISEYEEISGKGIKIKYRDKLVLVGNIRLMEEHNIKIDKTNGTIVYVAIDNKYAGNIVISDEIKKSAAEAIKVLKYLGVRKTVMLTGDNKETAKNIGEKLRIDEVYSELLPNGKVDRMVGISNEKSTSGNVIFIGDGINDAPVLAMADVGIAMGGIGSDAAIEAADVVIMNDELEKVAEAIIIARHTRKIVWENIIFALGIKLILLFLGAVGITTMWEAVFGDVGVAVLAILNSMRVMGKASAFKIEEE